jgi:Holliday junction resolvase RusA-like endonuclease
VASLGARRGALPVLHRARRSGFRRRLRLLARRTRACYVSGVAFTAYGVPQPAGSKKAFVRGGRALIVDDAKGSEPWKKTIAQVAGAVMAGRTFLEGPLRLDVDFYLPRPKGHMGTGRNAGHVRGSAPAFPIVKPDATKLLRAVEDSLTGVVWRDDAQVAEQHVRKHYGEPARVEVRVDSMLLDEAAA